MVFTLVFTLVFFVQTLKSYCLIVIKVAFASSPEDLPPHGAKVIWNCPKQSFTGQHDLRSPKNS
jgi:hypothetical protein